MADEPSIDEILASLDRLLKEGEGRNDEPEEPAQQASGEEAAGEDAEEIAQVAAEEPAMEEPEAAAEEMPKETIPEPVEDPDPGFFTALDRAVSEPYNEAWAEDTGEEEIAASGHEPVRTDVGDQESTPAEAGPRRIVLTDAMLVDDVQQPLPLAMGGAASMAPATAGHDKPVEPVVQASGPESPESASAGDVSAEKPVEKDMSWDAQDIQALVDQVTDDVCSAIAGQLPELIRHALESRLSAFIDEHTQKHDSGPEE